MASEINKGRVDSGILSRMPPFSWSESRFTAQAPVHARFAMAVLEMAAKSCRAGVMSERKR